MSASKTEKTFVMDRADAERRVLRTGWLADQPEGVRRAILKIARLRRYPAGEFLFHAGDGEGGLYGVVSGCVGIHLPSEAGETVLAHVIRSGVWFGYGPLLRGRERSLSFSLVEPSLLFHAPLASLQGIAARSPAHQRAILSVSDYGMDIAIQVIAALLIRNSDRRIAATLLRIAPSRDGEPSSREVHLTQAQLGEMANAERQVVNRALKRLQAKGWIRVSYGRIEIVDDAALADFARAR
jgi:CRP/FNR family cyclic AMP-dependent transcriptional regulator